MTARTSVGYIIAEVRRLTGAGSAEYTVDSTSYFTDDQIERVLDSRRIRLVRQPLAYEYEINTSGTVVYKRARVGYGWLEDVSSENNFQITDSLGAVTGTADYTFSPEDGYVVFDNDQAGSTRYATGWIHNTYRAAVDLLTSWNSELARQPDFATDNMRVWRSQKQKAILDQIDVLKEMGAMAPKVEVVAMARSDMKVEFE